VLRLKVGERRLAARCGDPINRARVKTKIREIELGGAYTHQGQVWANREQLQYLVETVTQVLSLRMVNARGSSYSRRARSKSWP